MADITDDFGRVNSFNTADLESLAKSLKSAVGQAVKYMSGQSKDSSDLGKKIEDLADSLEKLGDDVKESIASTKEFVKKVVNASGDIEKQKERRTSGLEEVRATQKEQTKVLSAILRSQQKALSDKVAKYTTGGVSLGTVSKKRPALADMGFKPRGTDRVPAMLSPGEFIVNRKGTQGNERLLNSINKGYKLGGRVKPSYLAGGSEIPSTRGSKTMEGGEIRLSGRVTTEFKDMEKIFDKAGEDAADSFAERFDKQTREKMARWATGVANLLMGGHSFTQVLFSGSVRDAMEFRVEMRELAFQTQGITGDLRGLQAEFANLGNSIVSETGKSVDILQKVYIKNLKKGFQENKAGLKVMKSGLFLSTMIGSEAESTADMFGDWYRTLRLSANQMDEMAFNMKDVARSTGITGDELVGAMKSSEGLLKNLRNQGNLTTSSAKALVEIMAEAKKSGTEDTTGRIMDALTSTNKLLGADDQTKNFVYSMAGGMGPEATQKALAGTLMKTREDRAAFADQMMKMFGSYSNGAIKSLEDFDKLSEAERFQMTLKLKAMGLEIDQAKELYKQIKKSSAPMKERLAEIDNIANSKFATDEEKRMNLQKKNELFLSESATNLSKIREKSSSMDISSALKSLGDDKEFINRMEQDFPEMYGALTDSMKGQFGLYGSEEQVKSQMAGMDLSKKVELSGLMAAQQAANIAKEKGIEYKDFGPDMAKALERGDSKAFNEAYDSFISERKKLDTQLEADTDPTKALTKSMTELNETIRKYTSSLVGGFIDLIGPLGLLAFQISFLATSMHQTFAKGILDKFSLASLGDLGAKFDDYAKSMASSDKDGILKRFFGTYTKSRQGLSESGRGAFGRSPLKNVRSSLFDAFKGLGDDIARGFNVAINASGRFFRKFLSGFKLGWKSSGNFFTAMSKGFARSMRSAESTQKVMGFVASGMGKLRSSFAGLRKVAPGLHKFLWNSFNLGKSFTTMKFANIPLQFGKVMKSGFGLFRSGFSSFLSIFKPGGLKGLFGAAKGLVSGGLKGIKAALLGGSLGTAQIIFSAIDMVFGSVSGFMRTGERFEGVLKAMGKTTNDATWGMYASSTVAGALVGILDGLTFGLLSVTGAAEWLNQTLSLVFYTVFSVVEGIVKGIMVPFQMVWSAVKYIGSQLKGIGDSILNVFNSIAGIFGAKAGNWSEAFAMIYPWLKGIGTVIGVIVGGPLMGFLWLMVKGISLALVPIQMLVNAVAGMVQVFAGVFQFVKDIFTVGISKAFWNLGATVIGAIYGIFKPVVDFVWSLGQDIIAPFKYLYNILVGNSIIPDLVFGIIKFFAMLPLKIFGSLGKMALYVGKSLKAAFLNIPKFALGMFKKVFVDFPNWLVGSMKSGLVALPGTIFSMFTSTFVKLPIYIWNGLKWAFGKLWDWIKSWIPEGVRSATAAVTQTAQEQETTRQDKGNSTLHALGGVVGSLYHVAGAAGRALTGDFSTAGSNLATAGGKAWSSTKEVAGAAWENAKAVGSYLNPFNYFQEGTRHIEKPGLAMLHQGEMVVPSDLTKKITAEGSGPFGNMAGLAGLTGSLFDSIGKINFRGQANECFCFEETAESMVKYASAAFGKIKSVLPKEITKVVTGSFSKIKAMVPNKMIGYANSAFERFTDSFSPLVTGFNRSIDSGEGFFSAMARGMKSQYLSMTKGMSIYEMAQSTFSSIGQYAKSAFESMAEYVPDSIKKPIVNAFSGAKDWIGSAFSSAMRGGKSIIGSVKDRLFGTGLAEGEYGPARPGLIEKAKGGAMSIYEKGKGKLFGTGLAEGEYGPAKPGLIEKAKGGAMSIYEKGKGKFNEIKESNNFKSISEKFAGAKEKALEKISSVKESLKGGVSNFKENMKSIAEGIREFGDTKVLFGAANLVPSGLGLTTMVPGYLGAKLFEKVDGKKLGESFKGLSDGLTGMGTAKVLKGAASLAVVGAASLALIPAVPLLAALGATAPMIKSGLMGLGRGLSAFGKAAANPYTWLGIAALGALGVAMIPLAYALSLLSPIVESFGKAIKSAFSGIADVIRSVGESVSMILKEVSLSKAAGLVGVAGGLIALGAALVGLAAGEFVAGWVKFFAGDGVIKDIERLASVGPNLDMTAKSVESLSRSMSSFAAAGGGTWSDFFFGDDGLIEGLEAISKTATPELMASVATISSLADSIERMQEAAGVSVYSIPKAIPQEHVVNGVSNQETPSVVPYSPDSQADVEPVHLRDITDSILRDRAGSGGNRLQSDELARMEEASYRQVEELEQIREGIKEMVSLLRPKGGSVVGDTSGSGHGRTKDPRRPLHAANFGKMKYGKVGGNANRSLVNNGES